MSNRKNVIDAIHKMNDKSLNSEIEYFMDQEREYPYDEADALNDALDIAECNNDRKITKAARLVLIMAGEFVPAPVKTDFGRDTRFTLDTVKYGWHMKAAGKLGYISNEKDHENDHCLFA